MKPEAGVEAPLPLLLSGFSSVSGELPLSLTAVLSGRLGVCEAASVWVGVRLRPRPGPVSPGPVRRAPGVYGRSGGGLSRFAGILSAAFSRRPRLASLSLENGT